MLNMKLSPRVLPGALHPQNKGASDWGWQGLLAYGCHNHVVVFDPKTVQVIQVLDLHSAPCTKVKWGRENYHHDFASPYNLRLASGDASGRIIVWDIALGKPIADFVEGSRPVLDLDWLSTQDACHDLLAALHAPSSLVLWNADTGTKLWKKNFQESVLCFAFDPFCPSNVTLMCQDWILFIDDFSINRAPESNGRRFYLTSSGTASPNSPGPSTNTNTSSSRSSAPKSALARVKLWAAGEPRSRSGEESVALSECLQLMYLPSCNHHLLALFPREVMILDMEINQAVCSFCLERNSPSFLQIIPCRQRDVLMCLHENGCIIMRSRRRVTRNPYFLDENERPDPNMSVDIVYETKSQSDTLRLSKSSRLYGFQCCPISEKKLVLLISDGRVIIWDLRAKNCHTPDASFMTPESLKVSVPVGSDLSSAPPYPVLSLTDIIPPPLTSGKVLPHSGHIKFIMCGLMSAVASPPTCAVMCPPLTTKNWANYKPLIAIGTTHGSIQVFNLSTGIMQREYSIHTGAIKYVGAQPEYSIHTGAIKGITWTSLSSFFSWAQTSGSSSKNEIQLLDLKTGHSTHISVGKVAEEVPIECIKVSQLRQYFFIAFKERPLQLWDLKNLCLLKELPRAFPNITALEWSPSHSSKQLKKKLSAQLEAAGGSNIAANVLDPSRTDTAQSQVWIKEHFVCVDVNGLLYHFLVEGNVVKDGSKVQCDSTLGVVSCMAWKGDLMVLADNEGNLSVWELKARITRLVATHRGQIKKIKFAPGRGNFKLGVLYNDGMDVWDLLQVEIYSSYKIPKDASPSVDMDWLASDLPLIIQASGCLQVMDLDLKSCSSAMANMHLHDPIWCAYVLESKTALVMKTLLQHHLGRPTHSLQDLSDLELHGDLLGVIQDRICLMPPSLADFIPVAPLGTAQKCFYTAHLFGDEAESVFWDVALHYLRREKARLSCPMHKTNHRPPVTVNRPRSSSDLFNPTDATARIKRSFSSNSLDLLTIDDDLDLTIGQENGTSQSCCCFAVSLDTCYEILCDSDAFQKSQLDRIALHDSKRSTYEHTRKCAEALVLLGQADRAVQLFLETDASNDNYYVDSLRACLVATIRSSGASQSTIKLVATNLIASGKLAEGVQLLCLIDKGLDACRYLQTYGEWEQAASLAKATLNYPDCAEVMRRWIEHLSSTHTSQQSKAILVLLSLGQFCKVLEMLHSMRYFDRAAMFAEACQEFGFDFQHDERILSLMATINAEYARYLQGLGLKKPALYFANKAGDKGQELLERV